MFLDKEVSWNIEIDCKCAEHTYVKKIYDDFVFQVMRLSKIINSDLAQPYKEFIFHLSTCLNNNETFQLRFYFNKICWKLKEVVEPEVLFNVLRTCIIILLKYNNDNYINIQTLAAILDLQDYDVNLMERNVLNALNYNLSHGDIIHY
jgi:hypothetical protein